MYELPQGKGTVPVFLLLQLTAANIHLHSPPQNRCEGDVSPRSALLRRAGLSVRPVHLTRLDY
jgi:hypothetical protein